MIFVLTFQPSTIQNTVVLIFFFNGFVDFSWGPVHETWKNSQEYNLT